MLWLRKLTALMLISAGVSLVLLPFPGQLTGQRDREAVYLEIQPPPFTAKIARERFGNDFVTFTYEALTAYPEILDAVLGMMSQSGKRCVSRTEWRALLADVARPDETDMIYAFRDGLYRMKPIKTADNEPEDPLACLEIIRLGAYNNTEWWPMRYLDADDLDDYPALASLFKKITVSPVPVKAPADVSPRQWQRFERRLIDKDGYHRSFVVFDKLISGSLENEPVPWTLDTRIWRNMARGLGILALLLGIGAGLTAYRWASARQGIPIAPPWMALFCDLILVAGGVVFVALAIDTLWVAPLGQTSLLGLRPEWPSNQKITGLHFISIPAVIVVLPLLSLFFTRLSCQRVGVDEDGVTSFGAMGSVFLAWTDLKDIRIQEQRNPFAFTVTDFRPLQQVIALEGSEYTVTINEPSSRRRKEAIINAFEKHLPETRPHLLKNLTGW